MKVHEIALSSCRECTEGGMPVCGRGSCAPHGCGDFLEVLGLGFRVWGLGLWGFKVQGVGFEK